MRSFMLSVALLAACAFTAIVAFDDPVTGECGKDWEPRAANDDEIRIAAEYAAHVHSQKAEQEFKDMLVNVLEAHIKPCRWPKYNFTAIYGLSNCKVGDFDTMDCSLQTNEPMRRCKVYMWVPPGRGGRLESYVCERV